MNPRVLTAAEMNKLLRSPDGRTPTGRRDAALLALMLGGGLRLHEAAGLRKRDVQGRTLLFEGKGRKLRTVVVPKRVVRLVVRQMEQAKGDYVFPGRFGGSLSVKQAYNVVKYHARAAGLEEWVHPHSLRHTFASVLMRETGNLFQTQRVLGHSSPDTTARYYLAFSTSDAEHAAEAIDRVLAGKSRQSLPS